MPERSRARAGLRRAFGLLPPAVRARLLDRLSGVVGIAGADLGLVSVVVVAEPGDRLEDALASVRGQSHPLLDVVVCPVGPHLTAAALPSEDPRFRTVAPHATWWEAANAGLAASYADSALLLRGCDTLSPDAVTRLATVAREAGAAVVRGRLGQAGEPEPWIPAADAVLPTLSTALVAARALRLGPEDDWLCSVSLARLLAGEHPTPLVDHEVSRWAHERGQRAFGAQPSPLPDLRHWVDLHRRVLEATAGTPYAARWRTAWADAVLPRFLADAERADDRTWLDLVALARDEDVDDPALHARSRALLWLAAQDRRPDLEALSAETTGDEDAVPTALAGDHPVAVWRSVSLPESVARLGETEDRLHVRVLRRHASSADLLVRVGGVDLFEHPWQLTATTSTGPCAVTTTPEDLAAAQRWAGTRLQGAGSASVSLPGRASEVEVTVTVGPLSRTTTVTLPDPPRSPRPAAVVVDHVTLEGDELVVRASGAAGLRLVGPGVDIPATTSADGTLRFPTTHDLFGRQVWLPTAHYRLEHAHGVSATSAWRLRLPVEVVGTHHRLRVLPQTGDRGDGAGEVHLGPPLPDESIGAFGQRRLRSAYAVSDAPTDPALVYLESYAGRSATDSPLAVFEQLRARRPDLRLVWGVVDRASWVPDGATPVVLRTPEWYDVLARARCLVTNTELEDWWVRRPGQYVVQTFHGYPSKAMGESQWLARRLPPRRVAVMRRRSVETWDLILTPTPEATEHYRREYGYTGPAHELGYPRNDVLRDADSDRVRAEARAALGIPEDRTAVLYAPTWRDHLATRPRAAAMSDHLDVRQAAALLGDSHVLLVRGHRFHTGVGDEHLAGSARVVDVTAHPEVNELILASDVAVLDYSSLRFDYAVTGKPMVFLVPDLADYTLGVRGFLHRFEETAPGPLVEDTIDVVAQVRDVPTLAAEWGRAVREFDERYNPWQDGLAAHRVADVILAEIG